MKHSIVYMIKFKLTKSPNLTLLDFCGWKILKIMRQLVFKSLLIHLEDLCMQQEGEHIENPM